MLSGVVLLVFNFCIFIPQMMSGVQHVFVCLFFVGCGWWWLWLWCYFYFIPVFFNLKTMFKVGVLIKERGWLGERNLDM
jgi:hypothetical protein